MITMSGSKYLLFSLFLLRWQDGLVYCSYPSCSAGAEVGSTNIVDIAGDISMLLNDDLKTTRDSMEKVDAVYMDSEVLHTSRTADPFFRSEVILSLFNLYS